MTTATLEQTKTETIWDVELSPCQDDFIYTEVRYPGFVGGWGSGKSLALIIKCVNAAQDYPQNLILIVRYSYTDLRDSTCRDFEKYTGMTIPSNKDVRFPNGSVIMFRHGSQVATLQNLNLGAFAIEQAEEFDSDNEFQLLRGRLRREGMPHFGAVIANQRGHNWIWNLWKQHNPGRSDEFRLWEATTFDNHKLPQKFLDDLRRMEVESPTKYAQYVMNSWDELDAEGAYYAKLIGQARTQKHIGRIPWDSNAPVYTFWDLGFTDSTAVIFAQFIRNEVHIIDYYENNGEALTHYIKVLQDKPYIYGEDSHWGPHDLQAKNLQTARTTAEVARELGVSFGIVEQHLVQDGIEAVRGVLPLCWIDEDNCGPLIEALEHYRRKRNNALSTDERPVFGDGPLHDWASHAADAFRYLAMTYRYHLQIGGIRIGCPDPVAAWNAAYYTETEPYDPFERIHRIMYRRQERAYV